MSDVEFKDFPLVVTTNKPYRDYRIGDIRCYYEVAISWMVGLADARKTRDYFASTLKNDAMFEYDLNIYFITQKCVLSNAGNKAFEDLTKDLVEEYTDECI